MRDPLVTTSSERVGEHLVVHVAGEVDMTSAAIMDKALADAVTAEPVPGVIVADLTNVGFFGSAGLSVLIAAHRRTQDIGIHLAVVAPPGSIPRRTIDITGINHMLPIADTLDQALHLP